jgi:hypothetical protein
MNTTNLRIGRIHLVTVPSTDALIVTVEDIDAAHADLRSAGLAVDDAIARPGSSVRIRVGAVDVVGPAPPMFRVRDPDGNALRVVQPG